MNNRRKRLTNYLGERFGKLIVIGEAERKILPSGQKPRVLICRCDCGKETTVLLLHLVRQRIKSCGCITKVLNGESLHPICRAWKSMRERCRPDYSDRHLYYEKGVRVCTEWEDYFVFKKWALQNGFRNGLVLDRIDGNKGYSPENCRFVTTKVNSNNRCDTFFVNYKNEKIAFMLLIEKLKIPLKHVGAIRGRIARGWEHNAAIDTPIQKLNYKSR